MLLIVDRRGTGGGGAGASARSTDCRAAAHRAAGRLAIAKFPSAVSDTWNVMAWEKVALDLARDAGVIVPRSELIRVGDRHARQRGHPHDGR